jgi:opacity protein-like surface antigen
VQGKLTLGGLRSGLIPALLFTALIAAAPAFSQAVTSSDRDETTVTGTVVSTTKNTLVIRTDDGQHRLFTFDRPATRPADLAVGNRVTITSIASDEASYRVATNITTPAAGGADRAIVQPVVPTEIRNTERQIERQVRRYHGGFRAGLGLDPELVMLGAQAEIGPFFTDRLYFRPNVDFGFGEVTAIFGLNLEAIYRLPVTSRTARWAPYVGIGPGFNLVHQNFTNNSGGSRIDFGEFHSDTGLNILGGIRYRSGMFAELKTSVYSDTAPTLRMFIGYNF